MGMDVNKNYLQVGVLDENGKILNNSRAPAAATILWTAIDSLEPVTLGLVTRRGVKGRISTSRF